MPGDAPMMAAGLPFNALPRGGLDNQSIAFFSTPGTPWLYSGVAISKASACRIAAQAAGETDNRIDPSSAGRSRWIAHVVSSERIQCGGHSARDRPGHVGVGPGCGGATRLLRACVR